MHVCIEYVSGKPTLLHSAVPGPFGLSTGWLAGWLAGVRAYIIIATCTRTGGAEIEKENEYATRGFQTSGSSRSCTFVMQYMSVYRTGLRLSLRFALALRVQEVLIKREINRIRFH